MIFTFYKSQGLNVGSSLVEEDMVELAGKLMSLAKSKGVKLVLPTDVVLADTFSADATSKISPVEDIDGTWMGLDIGPDSVKLFKDELSDCNTILWNGPMGVFEYDAFANGTYAIADILADATESRGAITIVGGGDSVAAVNKAGLGESMSHISTGGGASLELLEGKVLPGIQALSDDNDSV
jgi:phosphoglycerate kinase